MNYGADARIFADAAQYPELYLARVIAQYQNLYKIIDAEGEALAEVSGKFRYEAAQPSDYPAVGDFVMTERTDEGKAVIRRVLARRTVFARRAAGRTDETQIVATNIDILFICMSLNNDYNLSRLERYLSVAWESGARPVIVLTKSDLREDVNAAVTEISAVAPGTDIVITSAYDRASCEKLRVYLKPGITASFVGSSGVGKSTLINCLTGNAALHATAEIRRDGKGRHTTTRRELTLLAQGGIVIDTPGMREFGAQSVNLADAFSDIDQLAENCRFCDCTHTVEPGCAVLHAVETGLLDVRRLENYKKLKKEARYDGLTARQIEEEKINAMFGGKSAMKKMRDLAKEKNKRR